VPISLSYTTPTWCPQLTTMERAGAAVELAAVRSLVGAAAARKARALHTAAAAAAAASTLTALHSQQHALGRALAALAGHADAPAHAVRRCKSCES
jgi:hypothetical protein